MFYLQLVNSCIDISDRFVHCLRHGPLVVGGARGRQLDLKLQKERERKVGGIIKIFM